MLKGISPLRILSSDMSPNQGYKAGSANSMLYLVKN